METLKSSLKELKISTISTGLRKVLPEFMLIFISTLDCPLIRANLFRIYEGLQRRKKTAFIDNSKKSKDFFEFSGNLKVS